ncbi:hypothetical protein B0O80DRAFT_434570 [Mortierella sp. GBAus27b]|nr:hypothetical protein BGX31_002571 [Mortierella sp. GBA43]KAI8361879.1 hypothetical protein B0O80DRAFT_434570 [Mortierella sp. GBAus27b]
MRAYTILTFFLVLIAAVAVSAQNILDCGKCVKAAAKSITPCSQIDVDISFLSNSTSDKDGPSKLCYCSLASNFGWLDSCSSTCPSAVSSTIKSALGSPKDTFCKTVPQSSLTTYNGSPSMGPKIGIAVLLAIVAVAHALL